MPETSRRLLVSEVYDALGRDGSRAPDGLALATGRDLALRVGYDEARLTSLPPAILEAFVGAAALEPRVEAGMAELVVDLGCGAGTDALLLARRGVRVIALDASATMLSRLGVAGEKSLSLLRVRAQLPTIPVRTGVGAWVLLNGVANLVPERSSLLTEARRILRSGGKLLVADLLEWGEIPPSVRALPEAWAWCVAGATTGKRWLLDLEQAGFSNVTVEVLETIPPLARGVIQATAC